MQRLISLLGIPGLLLLAFIFCKDRKKLSYKIIVAGIGLQFFFALVVLRTRIGHQFFYWVARGAIDGVHLAIYVAAMLIAFIALVAMVNAVFGLFGTSFEAIMGWMFAPIAFLMGIPWKEAVQVGTLLGQKTVLNEFVAYLNLANGLASGDLALNARSITIATYALCGFANFGSLGIMIAGIGGMAPSRRHDLARLGFLSIISGSLAAFLTATIAGVLV